ncbi:hypothetical protein [Nocardia nepalensis]|uniref:hypothetical protein n=1 Tax=Nocardia nepalensis TaxID=3375448 RepID=UPI003B67969B
MTEQFPPTVEQLEELRRRGSAIVESVSAAATAVEWQHRAIAGEVFDAIGPIAEPAARVHDVIADAVYESIRGMAAAVGDALGRE